MAILASCNTRTIYFYNSDLLVLGSYFCPPTPLFPYTPPSPPRYPNPPQKFVTWASLEAKLNYLSEASRENIKLNCISSSQWWARSSLLLIALLLFPLFQKAHRASRQSFFRTPFTHYRANRAIADFTSLLALLAKAST